MTLAHYSSKVERGLFDGVQHAEVSPQHSKMWL